MYRNVLCYFWDIYLSLKYINYVNSYTHYNYWSMQCIMKGEVLIVNWYSSHIIQIIIIIITILKLFVIINILLSLNGY